MPRHPARARGIALVILAVAAFFPTPAASGNPHGDCGRSEDVDRDATPFDTPLECDGHVANPGDRFDFYYLRVNERARISVDVTFEEGDRLFLSLMDPNQEIVSSRAANGSVHVGYVSDVTGVWRLQVSAYDASTPYHLSVTLHAPPPPLEPQDDCGSGRDAGNTYPARIVLPVDCVGETRDVPGDPDGYGIDGVDSYLVPVEGGEILRISVESSTEAIVCVARELDTCSTRNSSVLLEFVPPVPGEVVVWIYSLSNSTYRLRIEAAGRIVHEQRERVTTLVGIPLGVRTIEPDPNPRVGVYEVPIALARRAWGGERFQVQWESAVPATIEVQFFYEWGRTSYGTDCVGSGATGTIECPVPPFANEAVLFLRLGAGVEADLTYAYYGDVAGPLYHA